MILFIYFHNLTCALLSNNSIKLRQRFAKVQWRYLQFICISAYPIYLISARYHFYKLFRSLCSWAFAICTVQSPLSISLSLASYVAIKHKRATVLYFLRGLRYYLRLAVREVEFNDEIESAGIIHIGVNYQQ